MDTSVIDVDCAKEHVCMTSICQIIHTLLFLYDVIVVPILLFEGGRVVIIITIETSTALIPSLCTFHLLKL